MMARGKFGWERDEFFAAKRVKLAESVIDTRSGLIIVFTGVAFLLLVFFVAPIILFGGLVGLLALIPLMALFGAMAWGSARLLRIEDDPDDANSSRPQSERDSRTGGDKGSGSEEEA